MTRILPPTTNLSAAMRRRRATRFAATAATELGISSSTYFKIEEAQRKPSPSTALALARWLGWTMEQVYEAANTPVSPPCD